MDMYIPVSGLVLALIIIFLFVILLNILEIIIAKKKHQVVPVGKCNYIYTGEDDKYKCSECFAIVKHTAYSYSSDDYIERNFRHCPSCGRRIDSFNRDYDNYTLVIKDE